MSQSKGAEPKSSGFPRWLAAVGLIAGAAAVYVGNRGPGVAVQEFKEAFGHYEPPKIVALRPNKKEPMAFNVSIENPSLRQVQITTYYAMPLVLEAGHTGNDGGLPLLEAGDEPVPCDMALRFELERPLLIEPQSAGGLTVRPWTDTCDFALVVEGTTGASNPARWAPETDAMMRAFE